MTRLYQPPLLIWALAFAAAAAAGLASLPDGMVAAGTFTSAAVGAICASRLGPGTALRRTNITLLLLTPALFGAGVWRAESSGWPDASLARSDFGEQTVTIKGVVVSEPVFRGSDIEVRVQAEELTLGGERQRVSERVQFSLPGSARIALGDRIRAQAVLTPTAGGSGDGYLSWLAAQGVAAVGEVRSGSVSTIDRDPPSWWRRAALESRAAVNDSLRSALPPPLAGVAQGMVSGERHAIDQQLREDLNVTSLSHLIVVSGSNLTLLTAIIMGAAGWLLGRRPAAALAMAAALAYAAFAGGDPPVVRALVMALVFAAAHLLGRGAAALDAVALAAGLMIALEPQILRDVSFQLTLAGTLGLVLLTPSLTQRQLVGVEGLGGALRAVTLVSLVAMLATMPLIALHFQRVSLIGIAANIAVAPLFGWMFLGSFTVGVVGVVSEAAAEILSWPLAWLPLSWLALAAENGAQIPGAAQTVRDFGPIHAALIYAAMWAAAVRPRREAAARWNRPPPHPPDHSPARVRRRTFAAALTTAVLAVIAAALWITAWDRDRELAVHFIDVGQGDAALIVTPDRQTILIDTGARADPLLAALRKHLPRGAKRIDLVVVTHPHADHAEAAWALLERYRVGAFAASPHLEQTSLGRDLADTARSEAAPLHSLEAGRQIVFESRPHDLMLDVLWPPRASDLAADWADEPNALGIVIRLRYGDAALLFSADLGAEQEIRLAQQSCSASGEPCLLRADVLKVAHHGSRNSTTRVLLDRVRPRLAVISVGAGGRHGHPHEETVTALEQSGVAVLTTAERGTVSLRSDGRSIRWSAER